MDRQAMDIKELYFETDIRKHQQIAAEHLIMCAKNLLDRAIVHDASKLLEPERSAYIEPVYALNTENVEYGSDRYKHLTKQMGVGWEHHKLANDHHIEFFMSRYIEEKNNNPLLKVDLFALIEMCCDWIAAASRRGNSPELALNPLIEKYKMDEQLQSVMRNTLRRIQLISDKG